MLSQMAPEVTQDLWWSIFAFLYMEWPDAAALAFSFEEVPHRPGRHRHDETGHPQQWLSGIRMLACEFNEAMAHKWCLADEQMARLQDNAGATAPLPDVPTDQRLCGSLHA